MEACYFQNKGLRNHMEDFVVFQEDFLGKENCFLGGIFDGHGGDFAARLAARMFPVVFKKYLEIGDNIQEAMLQTMEIIDDCLNERFSGTTALVFLIRQTKVLQKMRMTVANIGDSRLVVFGAQGFQQITKDHNLLNEKEKERVLAAEAKIMGRYACCGNQGLSMTRALGAKYYRRIGIIPDPEFFEVTLEAGDTVAAASDGLWEQMSIKAVEDILKKEPDLKTAGQKIMNIALLGDMVGTDNISLILVKV